MTAFAEPVVAWRGSTDPTTPGRLDGRPVLVIHGDQDTVIPGELLDRTWSYLASEAGAATTAVRDPGGHGLSPGALAEVQRWLAALSSAP